MRNLLGRVLFAALLKHRHSGAPGSGRMLEFLASHPLLQRLLTAVAKSRPVRSVVAGACREALARYGDTDVEVVFRRLKDFRNFSEDTEINAVSEIYERAAGTRWTDWISDLMRGLGDEIKERLLERVAYNIGLNGINRKIDRLRDGAGENRIPNLSTIFLGTTSRCNLACRGCESRSERDDGVAAFEDLDYIIRQGKDMRIFHVVLIGKGEPLFDQSHKDLLFRLVKKHWDLNFLLFTNGTTITSADAERMRGLDNLFPLVSLDGLRETNDRRRGTGVFEKVAVAMRTMKDLDVLFGFSATVFKENYSEVLSEEFLSTMKEMGCKTGVYLKYIPLDGMSACDMMLGAEATRTYEDLYQKAQKFTPIPIFDPEIIERSHGCRARRGSVVYIDACTGSVMPCVKTPFAPAGCNLLDARHKHRLREVLGSPFYVAYRKSYSPHSQCSGDLKQEIGRYVATRGLSPRDRAKAQAYLAEVSTPQV
jgi:MoaA/NifB/PqqE/SkfB family radical SAM enzyme